MKPNLIAEKSVEFAIRTIKLYKILTENRKEFVLSKQIKMPVKIVKTTKENLGR